MLVLQILGIPLVTTLLIGAIFAIGSEAVQRTEYPRWNDPNTIWIDKPELTQPKPPPDFPRQGCNL